MKKYFKKTSTLKGFTLVEILMALVLIALGSTVAIRMQIGAMIAVHNANYLSIATVLAESQINSLRTMKFETGRDLKDAGKTSPLKRDTDFWVTKDGGVICESGKPIIDADTETAYDANDCFFHIETTFIRDSPVKQKAYQALVEVSWAGSGASKVVYDVVITDL